MPLTTIDWVIVVSVLLLMIFSVQTSKKLMRSVADFLAANRTAGRYLLSVSSGIASLGAITIVANLEMNLIAGFSLAWWGLSMALIVLVVTVSGWVIYRFRQTRSLTLAQFFEVRYSRNFRVFAGIIAFVSGIINFGIFPAVGARFFVYFCNLPETVALAGLPIPVFPLVMALLLVVSIYFVFSGGQVAVIFADFFQGVFVNLVFILLILYLFLKFDWSVIQHALASAPADASLINPFKTGQVKDFNFWYFLIGVFGFIYCTMSWQGTQAYNASAKNAHEAKMGSVLSGWRGLPQNLMFLFIPIIAYTVLHHQNFAGVTENVNNLIAGGETEAIKNQLRVPMVLRLILPTGLIGGFVAVMLSAFVSNHATYLHSWGSILIQDVLMPLHKKPYKPEQHIRILRISIIAVAVFIFIFSLFFKQSQYILLFFAVTGAIYAGGSGAVIIGGLYWKRGTTAAAWSAMITGSSIAVGGIILQQIIEDFPINGQMFWGIAMLAAAVVYIAVSLVGKKQVYDLDKILKRGKYAVKEDEHIVSAAPERGWRLLGMGKEFTRGDKLIYIFNYIWTGGWVIIFIAGTIANLIHVSSDESWMKFWKIYLIINIVMAVISFLWFTIGGVSDLKNMIAMLKSKVRDDSDHGYVEHGKE